MIVRLAGSTTSPDRSHGRGKINLGIGLHLDLGELPLLHQRQIPLIDIGDDLQHIEIGHREQDLVGVAADRLSRRHRPLDHDAGQRTLHLKSRGDLLLINRLVQLFGRNTQGQQPFLRPPELRPALTNSFSACLRSLSGKALLEYRSFASSCERVAYCKSESSLTYSE